MRVLIVLAVFFASAQTYAGVLQDVRDEARGESNKQKDSSSDSKDDDDDEAESSGDDTSNSELDDAIGYLFVQILISPWRLPYLALEEGQPRKTYVFLGHPYSQRRDGALMDTPVGPGAQDDMLEGTQSYALQGSFDGGLGGHRLYRATAMLRLQFKERLQFETACSSYAEQLALTGWDQLVLGRANVAYRFAQNEFAQFYTGLGVNALVDDVGSEFGVDVRYGLDLFVGRPVVISFSGGVGSLGKAFAAQARLTAGVSWRALELLTGYEATWIGAAGLYGPLLGMRVWW